VDHALGQAGFARYDKLLANLFFEFAKIKLSTVRRDGSKEPLLDECKKLQGWRNMEVIAMARHGYIHTDTTEFPLEQAVDVYAKLKAGKILGRAVLVPNRE
jgi:hypothetical protein